MITGLDHLVLTVADMDATLRFYRDGLGMRYETFGEGRSALHFGDARLTCTSPAKSSSRRPSIPRRARPTSAF